MGGKVSECARYHGDELKDSSGIVRISDEVDGETLSSYGTTLRNGPLASDDLYITVTGEDGTAELC